ncbi:unnamed protein product [Jaminaea pallidilutea]
MSQSLPSRTPADGFLDVGDLAASIPSAGPSNYHRSSAPRPPDDPAALLDSLKSIGLATDLSTTDLSITSTSASAASSRSSSSSSSSSLSILLSRLSLLLSDLSRLIEAQVRENLTQLLLEASRVQGLQSSVHNVRKTIVELDSGLEKSRAPVRNGVTRIKRDQRRLRRLNELTLLAKEASRFVWLARGLESSLKTLFSDGTKEADSIKGDHDRLEQAREEALVRSARALQDMDVVLNKPDSKVAGLAFVRSYKPSIDTARSQVLDRMEQSIVLGLRDLNPSLLSSSLLAASSLNVLQDLVKDLMNDLTDVVRKRVEVAFASVDGSSGAETGSSSYYSSYRSNRRGANNAPSPSVPDQAALAAVAALSNRLTTLMSVEMTAVCSKIYLLQRVLSLMRRPVTGSAVAGDTQATASSITTPSRRAGHAGHYDSEDSSEDEDDNSSDDDGGYEDAGAAIPPTTLLDQVVHILGDPPTLLFWRTFASALSKQRLPASVASVVNPAGTSQRHNHAHQTFVTEMRRLVDVFFEKTNIWTGLEDDLAPSAPEADPAAMTGEPGCSRTQRGPGPEKTLLLRSLGGIIGW